MDSRINQMNNRRPRGVVGAPYQVLRPVCNPPIVPPIGNPYSPYNPAPMPPPPQNVNIIVNKDDEDQGVTDYKQDVSISTLSARLALIEELLNGGLGALTLGTTSEQAYPGNEGQTNRTMIEHLFNDLAEYATISSMNENIEYMKNEMIQNGLSSFTDYDSIATETEVSGIVTSMFQTSDVMSTVVSSIVSSMQVQKESELNLEELERNIQELNITI